MGLSKLSEECKNCPFVSRCKHKRMEALAYMTETQVLANAAGSKFRKLSSAFITRNYDNYGKRYANQGL